MGKKDRKSPAPWYAEGLRFACQPDCGGCCTDHGEYTYIYLELEDLVRLSEHLGMTEEEFQERHTDVHEGRRVLKTEHPDCPFLDGARCTVYPARPVQCRTFPFWPENLESPAHWESVGKFCPGIGKGEVQGLPVIQAHMAAKTGSE